MLLALIGITGSRGWTDIQLLEDTLLDTRHDARQIGYDDIELMQGCAEGADTLAGQWALRNGILVRERPADWEGSCAPTCQPGHRRRRRGGGDYCPVAGHRRNQDMVDERPAIFLAFSSRCTAPRCANKPVHGSHGTDDCLRRARAASIPDRTITDWEEGTIPGM
ncbi:SLOG family protein [Streptomyces sp. NPDC089424]|uniref:SLOG family protein n=1 Tax=Streptomyces sp. NPDC089424 TaxID=3365917 RepID=UPI0038212F3C